MQRIAMLSYAHPFGDGSVYGAERSHYYLGCEYRKMGHEVTFFAIDGCVLPGFKYVKMPKPWLDDRDIYKEAVLEHGPFDFIHSYAASGKIDLPFWYSQPYCLEPYFPIYYTKDNIIAYSKLVQTCIATGRHEQYIGFGSTVIYIGLPDDVQGELEEKPDDYLVWVGRIDAGKAPDIAIDVAKRAGMRIILMGPAYHYPYFVDNIWPQIDDDRVIWLRGADDVIKYRVLRKAKCFISPNWAQYGEMFGLTNIEALACGVPVIGWYNPNYPSAIGNEGGEIIEHEKHGFINPYAVFTDEERERTINLAVDWLKQIDQIDRRECRDLFERRFTAKISADKHLKYYDIVKERGIVNDITDEIGLA